MLITFLVTLLILCIVIYVLNIVIGMLTLPPQVRTIALLIVGIIGLVILLQSIGVAIPGIGTGTLIK